MNMFYLLTNCAVSIRDITLGFNDSFGPDFSTNRPFFHLSPQIDQSRLTSVQRQLSLILIFTILLFILWDAKISSVKKVISYWLIRCVTFFSFQREAWEKTNSGLLLWTDPRIVTVLVSHKMFIKMACFWQWREAVVVVGLFQRPAVWSLSLLSTRGSSYHWWLSLTFQ